MTELGAIDPFTQKGMRRGDDFLSAKNCPYWEDKGESSWSDQ
jgi:hypothetical protein